MRDDVIVNVSKADGRPSKPKHKEVKHVCPTPSGGRWKLLPGDTGVKDRGHEIRHKRRAVSNEDVLLHPSKNNFIKKKTAPRGKNEILSD